MLVEAIQTLHSFQVADGICASPLQDISPTAEGEFYDYIFEAVLAYLVGMSPVLVLGPVGGVGESFVAAFMFTHVWFLSSVRSQVRFQVF